MAKRTAQKSAKDITGIKYGKLTAIEKIGVYRLKNGESSGSIWRCLCDCGNYVEVVRGSLTSGNTRSCGCLREESCVKHHGTGTRLYQTYRNMINRCYRPDTDSYHLYGAKGVAVCKEWKDSFNNFRDWALSNGYNDDLTIDRIDNNGDYCPDNCRWATTKEQASHTSHCHYVYDNDEKLTVTQFSQRYDMNLSTLLYRIKHWGEDVAIEHSKNEYKERQGLTVQEEMERSTWLKEEMIK